MKAERDDANINQENAALEAENAELQAALAKQREVHQKWMRERPVAPHPVDQLNNLSKALHEDAEAECEALRAQNAELQAALKAAKLALEYAGIDEVAEAVAAIDAALAAAGHKQ